MMTLRFSIVLLSVLSILIGQFGTNAKSIGDVTNCINGNLKFCHDKCAEKIPASKKAAAEKCFGESGDPLATTKDCLSSRGITNKSPCFKAPRSPSPTVQKAAAAQRPPSSSVLNTFGEFLSCLHECVMKQKECDEGCSEATAQVKSALDECLKDAIKKGKTPPTGPMGCLEKLT